MAVQRSMKASEVREHWSAAVEAVASGETRIRIERSGVPVAGLVSAGDLAWLAERDRRLAELRGVVEQMRTAFADVPIAEIEREVEDALSSAREETRAGRQDVPAERP